MAQKNCRWSRFSPPFYKRLKESQNQRQHLLLSTLSATPLIVEDIRHEETWPGLHSNRISLLYLLEMIIDDWVVEINETGVIIGGRNLVHDCGLGRSIGYFLEPLIVLELFGKKPLHIRLKGAVIHLCALCPQYVTNVGVGKLSPYAIETQTYQRFTWREVCY